MDGEGRHSGGAGARVGISILAYNAASTIVEVLERLPREIGGEPPLVLVADDESADETAAVARRWAEDQRRTDIEVVRHPQNLGYGGNQVASYRWAFERDLDVLALLHGDAQYPPEMVPHIVMPVLDGASDACFGSRMLQRGAAKRGNMPLTRRVGNRVLSTAQNLLTGASLSEWHSGFRAFRVSTLRQVDLSRLPSGFDADTAMVLELLDINARIEEIPIPTRYADEVGYLNPLTAGLQIFFRTLRYRLGRHRLSRRRFGRRRVGARTS